MFELISGLFCFFLLFLFTFLFDFYAEPTFVLISAYSSAAVLGWPARARMRASQLFLTSSFLYTWLIFELIRAKNQN